MRKTTINDVKQYWQSHPLLSYELAEPGSHLFFDSLDTIKKEDVEKFSLSFWEFEKYKGKKVLDVGCGPGWLTIQYAHFGANVFAVDLTPRAVELTKKYLIYKKLLAEVSEGNAEGLQFENDFFDLVVSSGVLHHTTDIFKALCECHRVLKHGGKAKITLYYKGFLLNKFFFPITKSIMRLVKVKHPGSDLSREAKDVNDFIRLYDGSSNPIGVGKSTKEWSDLLSKAGFIVEKHELHFFPRRFIPFKNIIPTFLHKILDRLFGTMIYFDLRKA